ncbi:glycoside hydrolase family 114 protein, partial [Stipitochalara longipes BDJ]
ICYFSAGTSEAARDDIGCFNTQPGAQDYGCNYGGNSPDEFWLNTTSREVRRIMLRRLDQAAQLGCDAVDPDNMDGYSNNNGIGETVADAADYMWFLIQEAHHRGLGIGLKNSDDLAMNKTLTDQLDFAVVEEC